jgi:hypothetical protein
MILKDKHMKNLKYDPESLFFYQNSLEEIDALIEGSNRTSAKGFEIDSSSKPKHTIQQGEMYISFKNFNVYEQRNPMIKSGISKEVLGKRGMYMLSGFLVKTQVYFLDSINRMKNLVKRKLH